MGYIYIIPLSETPHGAVGKPFENFKVLLTNAAEEVGGQNYEQALVSLQNNHSMTIQKANVEMLLQAQANFSSIHRPKQPRVDQEPTDYTPTETYNSPRQPTEQHPLILSMLNFKLPHSHCANDANYKSPKASSYLFARKSISITNTQVIQKLPLPGLPYDPANCRALHSLLLPPHPSSNPNPSPPSSQSSHNHLVP
jgi:hypothetical protein